MTYFTYNGRSSADFGLHIEKKDVFSAPEYDAEFISIPGRSGDIINPNRRFSNIKVTYTVFLARKNAAALAAVLRDQDGVGCGIHGLGVTFLSVQPGKVPRLGSGTGQIAFSVQGEAHIYNRQPYTLSVTALP